jgi:hypothetical protein
MAVDFVGQPGKFQPVVKIDFGPGITKVSQPGISLKCFFSPASYHMHAVRRAGGYNQVNRVFDEVFFQKPDGWVTQNTLGSGNQKIAPRNTDNLSFQLPVLLPKYNPI